MSREISIPGCLGEIRRWYSEYCSVDCRLAALCCLVAMCEHHMSEETAPPQVDIQPDLEGPQG